MITAPNHDRGLTVAEIEAAAQARRVADPDPASFEQIARHIEARIAKSTLDSPPVHLSRPAWAEVVRLLREAA